MVTQKEERTTKKLDLYKQLLALVKMVLINQAESVLGHLFKQQSKFEN